jgi:hypothetical protein
MQRAVKAYEEAHDLYEKSADEREAPWMLRCRAVSRDLSHWLASDPSKKMRLTPFRRSRDDRSDFNPSVQPELANNLGGDCGFNLYTKNNQSKPPDTNINIPTFFLRLPHLKDILYQG